jgi:hypothetical protein
VSELPPLVGDIKAEFPSFELVPKDESKLMKFLAALLKPFVPDFMKNFATTIGCTVYYPRNWPLTTMYEVLRHERVHMRDSKKWGSVYYLTYLLLPLPFVVSGRAYWEFRGYTETLKMDWEWSGKPLDATGWPVLDEATLDWVVSQFTSSSYLWMFPFPKTLKKRFKLASMKWVL